MKKKVMSAVLAAAMVVGMAGNVVTVSAKEKYDLPYTASTPQTRILRTGLQMWKLPRA